MKIDWGDLENEGAEDINLMTSLIEGAKSEKEELEKRNRILELLIKAFAVF